MSSETPLDTGIPQGSSISCLIFALYVGDAEMWVDQSLVVAYADDTMLLIEADSLDDLKAKIKTEGERLLRFFASNQMVANASKTGLLVFRPTRQAQCPPLSVNLAGEDITEVFEEKILGLIVNNELKWNGHVSKLQNECHYHLYVLRRLRHILTNAQLTTIAEGIIMSRLRYCLPVFGSEFVRLRDTDIRSSVINNLQKIQNDMLRIITSKQRRDHERIADMLADTKMLSINQLAAYSILLETWRAKTSAIPHLSSLLTYGRSDERTLRSDTTKNASASSCEPFAMCAAQLWNLTSERFKDTKSIIVAKKEARTTAAQLPQL